MADMTWPGTLPTNPLYGWTEVPGNGLARTETDAGPAKVRRRFTSTPSQFSLLFSMTQTQTTRLLDFYSNESDDATAGTAGGALTFDGLPHPRTSAASTWRFISPPVATQDNFEHFRVSLKLELLP